MKKNFHSRLSVLSLAAFLILNVQIAKGQCSSQVTNLSGESIVNGVNVTVTSAGIVSGSNGYCKNEQPYFIGYSPAAGSGTGSYTFNFSPAVSLLTLNISGTSNLGNHREEVRLFVNGSHYAMTSPGVPNECDAMAVLTEAGDLAGCAECSVSGWNGTTISGVSISSLTVENIALSGTPNGSLFSLFIGPACTSTSEWLRFNASLSEHKEVILNWNLPSALPNDYFTVERSADGKNWQAILSMMGRENSVSSSSSENGYTVIDPKPLKGNNHYRIKQIKANGSENYSEVRVVEVTAGNHDAP